MSPSNFCIYNFVVCSDFGSAKREPFVIMHNVVVPPLGPELNQGTQRQFSENICSEDDLRSRIFEKVLFLKFLGEKICVYQSTV